jgi:hypothetical protein
MENNVKSTGGGSLEPSEGATGSDREQEHYSFVTLDVMYRLSSVGFTEDADTCYGPVSMTRSEVLVYRGSTIVGGGVGRLS